jgi:hypothetical protein
MKLLPVLLIIAWAAVNPAGAQTTPDLSTPASAAKAFYTELQGRKLRGLSQNKDWDFIVQLMTPELASAVRRAQAEQADFIKKNPDEKPPWVDGDLFSSLFEGPQQFSIGKAALSGKTATVPLTFAYTESGNTTKWTDTLMLAKTEKGWLIQDLSYGGGWEFGSKGTLLDALAPAPNVLSPDGRFEFIPFSAEEADAGKPPFGIVEKATGKLIWSAPDDLGDATRPEETILWSPDSKRFALTSRVGTRHLACFLFGWQDTTFVTLPWNSGKLEELADLLVGADAKQQGLAKDGGWGQTITDDTLPVRWVDNDSLIMTRTIARSIMIKGEPSSAGGMARVLLRCNGKSKTFFIARDLAPLAKR